MVTNFINALQEDKQILKRIEHIEILPAREAAFGKLNPELPDLNFIVVDEAHQYIKDYFLPPPPAGRSR